MTQYTIQSFDYNEAGFSIRRDIATLLDLVWPDTDAPTSSQTKPPVSHRAELSARSFCCYSNHLLVGYAAVVYNEIFHCGHRFIMAGLSCVATHPNDRGCGIGHSVVSAATQYIAQQENIDIGIFTCHPALAAFYEKAGAWETCTNVILLGSHEVGALSSEALDVVVLMRLFSEKAQTHKALFCKEPISLDFPVGEFL
ncbi:MAG: GNAT family N-acetyltransferase [Angelakisella sp.]